MSLYSSKTDSQVRDDVMNEMMWDQSVTATLIKVAAHNGVVTLSGSVPHYIEKTAAEHAAQRVSGVKAVADELSVKGARDKTDEEIASAAIIALSWNYSVPDDIKISVDNGWVTLVGQAEWDYQRAAARAAVSDLVGVVGVTNNVELKSKAQPADIKTLIKEALRRSAESESRKIDVKVDGNKVTLTGNVHSFAEKSDAGLAAWNAPGVMSVQNDISISQ